MNFWESLIVLKIGVMIGALITIFAFSQFDKGGVFVSCQSTDLPPQLLKRCQQRNK